MQHPKLQTWVHFILEFELLASFSAIAMQLALRSPAVEV